MSKTYTLTEIAELLEVDAKTLRRWVELEEFDLSKQTSKYDKRIKWLTEEQAGKLAKAHERLWPPRPKSAAQAEKEATGLTGAVNMLREQVDELRADHIGTAQFSNTVKAITERLDALERGYTHQLNQVTDALLALKELQDWKAAQESKPRAGRKPRAQGEAQAQGED